MKTTILYPIFLLLLMACHDGHDSTSEQSRSPKTDFEVYLHSIPELGTPFSIRCDGEFTYANEVVPDSLWQKFRPEGFPDVMAKISYNDSIVGVIYVYPADFALPLLMTYNDRGIPIDSLQLIDRYCGLEYESEGYGWVRINGHQIELSDTTKYWARDEEHELIPNTNRTEMRKATFEVAPNGQIIKLL